MSTAVIGSHFTGTSTGTAARLRLTRRGRIVLTLVIVVPLVIAALFAIVNSGGAVASSSAGSSLHYVTVQGGETLWQLAGDIAPKADPREVVSDIVHLNQLASSDLQAGQRIAIPSQYETASTRK
jgi:LysM repeat protein